MCVITGCGSCIDSHNNHYSRFGGNVVAPWLVLNASLDFCIEGSMPIYRRYAGGEMSGWLAATTSDITLATV